MSKQAHAAPHAHHTNYVKIWAILTGVIVGSGLIWAAWAGKKQDKNNRP